MSQAVPIYPFIDATKDVGGNEDEQLLEPGEQKSEDISVGIVQCAFNEDPLRPMSDAIELVLSPEFDAIRVLQNAVNSFIAVEFLRGGPDIEVWPKYLVNTAFAQAPNGELGGERINAAMMRSEASGKRALTPFRRD